ncbi:DUF547 domain-containing protein [Pseudocolwellia sp. HL-MZ7]|uniref:DUF547 domain-containing protein n=1 Tax=Pseudocolwellia sp. HL-MZ7 TaxID=3400627 RepID=UPI003CF327FC
MLTIFSYTRFSPTRLKSGLNTLVLSTALLASSLVSAQSMAATDAGNMHTSWNTLLKSNVVAINNGHSTAVNYAGIKKQYSELKVYLDSLSVVTQSEFDSWKKPKQLAFLINAYNAWTVDLIVTNYPDIDSIKELGSFFSSPWSKEFVSLLGEKRSLDNLEHDLIRGAVDSEGKAVYGDPRIHFAVNCASIGCPALREEAFTADKLEQQLEEQTVRFLADSTRNFAKGNTLNVSSIFKWYRVDFEKGYKNTDTLAQFMLQYPDELNLSPDQQKALTSGKMDIEFLDYDWDLNAQH